MIACMNSILGFLIELRKVMFFVCTDSKIVYIMHNKE